MNRLIEVRENIRRIYAKYSKIVDIAFRFMLALMTFVFINSNIGFMKSISNPLVTLGLSIVCAFAPVTVTIFLAVAITILQFYVLSPGVAIVATVLFFVMFVLYFRFTPNQGIVLLLMPIASALKIPVMVPIVFGLIGNPICAIPIAFGTIASHMITYVKAYGTTIKAAGEAAMFGQMSAFIQQLMKNKEMGVLILAMGICLIVVYTIRKLAIENAWKIAIVSGGLVYILVLVFGKIILHTEVAYLEVILGSAVAIALALVVEFFVFVVDYSRAEVIQFEDDEYYYYVKAVPKVTVAAPEKTVKRINERQNTETLTKIKTDDSVKSQAEEMLLEKALQEELEIQELLEEELKN